LFSYTTAWKFRQTQKLNEKTAPKQKKAIYNIRKIRYAYDTQLKRTINEQLRKKSIKRLLIKTPHDTVRILDKICRVQGQTLLNSNANKT